MNYPKFFDTVESIKLQDPLADILGAFENGEYEISYVEVVKSAGHSCPTVAGAYLMTQAALQALYGEQRAVRGGVKVEFKEGIEDGVAGVIANVVTQITGATDKSGFKGLGGKHARHSLMFFHADINTSARFSRLDTQESVEVVYDPSCVAIDPQMKQLMQKLFQGDASLEEKETFGKLWQERVENIFLNSKEVIAIQ
jgi:formylmethanofuran dehydrogenase subunit E